MPLHAVAGRGRHRMMASNAMLRSRFGNWLQRAYLVPAKRRAALEALTGSILVFYSVVGMIPSINHCVDALREPQELVWVAPQQSVATCEGAANQLIPACQRLDLRR
jgi:hypothetical protein